MTEKKSTQYKVTFTLDGEHAEDPLEAVMSTLDYIQDNPYSTIWEVEDDNGNKTRIDLETDIPECQYADQCTMRDIKDYACRHNGIYDKDHACDRWLVFSKE